VDSAVLERCQKILDYRFNDPSVLAMALTHASVAPTRADSNERMEFLGDAVLGMVVCEELYRRSSEMLEGEMTKIKSTVVSRITCASMIEKMNIVGLVLMGKGLAGPGAVPSSVSAALFEAIIGAIYLDGGLEPARAFVLRHIQPFIQEALDNEHQHNYKSVLQQYAQKALGQTPEYRVLDEKGPDHAKCFEVAVSINGQHFPTAWGMNKKEAEQEAARRALVVLGMLRDVPAGQI
jgi:ribonuclease-3